MAILNTPNMIAWGVAAFICAYVAKKKGKHTHLALFLGLFLGIFAMIYYLFCKTDKKEWKKEHPWYILGGYVVFLILLSFF